MSEMHRRASLKAFLATARAALTAPASQRAAPLTFVVGNESADLDSLCSALFLAYFHTYAPPTKRALAGVGDGGVINGTLHIPVCHLQRADLALRPEFTAVLRDADIKGEDVFTLEDVLPPPLPPASPAQRYRHGRGGDDSNSNPATTKSDSPEKGNGGGAESSNIQPENTRWLLVDHNAMTGRLASAFGPRVFGCVDHHADEGVVPRDAEVRVIEKSGSCMSLVVERCAEIWDALGEVTTTTTATTATSTTTIDTSTAAPSQNGAETKKNIDAQLAALALAPILVDTMNLQDEHKTTAHDVRAVEIAERRIASYSSSSSSGKTGEGRGDGRKGDDNNRYDRDTFFRRIMDLKEDIAEMSLRDVFRKDYKEWSVDVDVDRDGDGGGQKEKKKKQQLRLGTSSVPRGFGYLIDAKSNGDAGVFADALDAWGREKDAEGGGEMDLVVVFTGFQDEKGRFCRELLVWARSGMGVRAARLFEEKYGEKLGLTSWRDGASGLEADTDRCHDGKDWRRCWTQSAVEHSRKQIAPMLRDALTNVAGR